MSTQIDVDFHLTECVIVQQLHGVVMCVEESKLYLCPQTEPVWSIHY